MSENVVKGSKELFKALDSMEKKIRNKILRTELRGAAKQIGAALKAAAPVGDDPEAGELRREVKVRSGKKSRTRISFVATVVNPDPTKFYAPFVEFGTREQHAQHFAEHTGDSTIPGLANSLPEAIWAAIESEGG